MDVRHFVALSAACSALCTSTSPHARLLLNETFEYPTGSYSITHLKNGSWNGTFDIVKSCLHSPSPKLGTPGGTMRIPRDSRILLHLPHSLVHNTPANPNHAKLFLSFLYRCEDDAPPSTLSFIAHDREPVIFSLTSTSFTWRIRRPDSRNGAHSNRATRFGYCIGPEQFYCNTDYSLPLPADLATHHIVIQARCQSNFGVAACAVGNPSLDSWPELFALDQCTGLCGDIPFSQLAFTAKGGDLYIDELRIGTSREDLGFPPPPATHHGPYRDIAHAPWLMIDSAVTGRSPSHDTADIADTPTTIALPDDDEILSRIMVIEGDLGSGTGVLLTSGTNTFLYTNLHVISGNKKIAISDTSGRRYAVAAMECAADRDLIRLTLRNVLPEGLAMADSVKRSDTITVYGNAEGHDVMRPVSGKILGIGPDKLEVNAMFVQGHSGSPVLTDDGEVAGIATYVTRPNTNFVNRDTEFSLVRRFAVRTDTVTRWIPVNPRWFVRESLILREKDRAIADAFSILGVWAKAPLTAKIPVTSGVTPALESWIRDHNEFVHRLRKRGQRYMTAALRRNMKLDYDRLVGAVQGTLNHKEPHWHLPQFKEKWDELQEFEDLLWTVLRHVKEELRID